MSGKARLSLSLSLSDSFPMCSLAVPSHHVSVVHYSAIMWFAKSQNYGPVSQPDRRPFCQPLGFERSRIFLVRPKTNVHSAKEQQNGIRHYNRMLGNGIYYCSGEYLAHCSAELSCQNMIRSSPASQSHNGANGGRGHNPYLIQILRR